VYVGILAGPAVQLAGLRGRTNYEDVALSALTYSVGDAAIAQTSVNAAHPASVKNRPLRQSFSCSKDVRRLLLFEYASIPK